MRGVNCQTAVNIRQNLAFTVTQKDIAIRICPICSFNRLAKLGRTAPESKWCPVRSGLVAVLPYPVQRILHFCRRQLIPEGVEVDVQRPLILKSAGLHFIFQEIAG
ncbi:hypothetical protein D3C80_1633350 [compost metagenome]